MKFPRCHRLFGLPYRGSSKSKGEGEATWAQISYVATVSLVKQTSPVRSRNVVLGQAVSGVFPMRETLPPTHATRSYVDNQ